MTKAALSVIFMTTILLTAGVFAASNIPDVSAKKAQGVGVSKYGKSTERMICGDVLCKNYPGGREGFEEDIGKMTQTGTKAIEEPTKTTEKKVTVEESMTITTEEKKMEKKAHGWKTVTKTVTSDTDPGIGHEKHQLAIILPPSDKVYKGILTFDASEPIQLVSLHGPLAEGEDKGQPIWTTDGETKFGLTFLDKKQSAGSWMFTGNAIAVHTTKTEPFTVTYTVSYMEKKPGETVMSGTATSEQDPGIGHESHQLAVLLPPSEKPYTGILTYTASEPIQLVSLHGPLAEGEDKGQPIWTTDGETKFGLTFVKSESAGTWTFTGNALAVHTMKTEPFTISYSIVSSQN